MVRWPGIGALILSTSLMLGKEARAQAGDRPPGDEPAPTGQRDRPPENDAKAGARAEADDAEPNVGAESADEEAGPTPQRARGSREGTLGTLQEPGTSQLSTADAEQPLPGRLGPAQIVINEHGNRLTIGMATQLRGDLEHQAAFAGDPDETTGGLAFRRLRTVLGSSFLEGKVRSSFQLNIAPSALELIDMWVLYAPRKTLGLRLGQFKIPYTRYRAQSFAALSLLDWSPVTRMFGAERQLGVEFLNPAPEHVSLEYSFGVFTGTNARASHAVGLSDVYGETPPNPSNLRNPSGPSTMHPELVGRIAKNFGAIDTSQNTDVGRGPLRQSIGLSGAWDARPVARQDLLARLAFEWLLKWQGLYFNGVAHVGWFDGAEGVSIGTWGWLAESGYRFNPHWELAIRFSKACLGQALQDDAAAYGAAQVGDGSDPALVEQYALAGRVDKQNELTAAGTYYIIGHSLKAQLGGTWLFNATDLGRQSELSATVQIQFQF